MSTTSTTPRVVILFTTFLRLVWAYCVIGYELACEGAVSAGGWLGQQCSDASVWLEAKLHALNTKQEAA